MKDICTISVVTFHPVWGDKASNLRRIEEYIECAYRKGSQIVIFPEMSLTGYDDEADKPFKEKMQYKLAETVPGPSTLEVAELTKKLQAKAAWCWLHKPCPIRSTPTHASTARSSWP